MLKLKDSYDAVRIMSHENNPTVIDVLKEGIRISVEENQYTLVEGEFVKKHNTPLSMWLTYEKITSLCESKYGKSDDMDLIANILEEALSQIVSIDRYIFTHNNNTNTAEFRRNSYILDGEVTNDPKVVALAITSVLEVGQKTEKFIYPDIESSDGMYIVDVDDPFRIFINNGKISFISHTITYNIENDNKPSFSIEETQRYVYDYDMDKLQNLYNDLRRNSTLNINSGKDFFEYLIKEHYTRRIIQCEDKTMKLPSRVESSHYSKFEGLQWQNPKSAFYTISELAERLADTFIVFM